MTLLAFVALLVACILGYALNRQAANALRDRGEKLHSQARYHGMFSALGVLVPISAVILLWLLLQGPVINALMMASLPAGSLDGLDSGAVQLVQAEITSIAGGRVFGTPDPWKLEAADTLTRLHGLSGLGLVASVVAIGIVMIVTARRKVAAEFRARQGSEAIVSGLMIFCSTVAIFTTIGIVAALVFNRCISSRRSRSWSSCSA